MNDDYLRENRLKDDVVVLARLVIELVNRIAYQGLKFIHTVKFSSSISIWRLIHRYIIVNKSRTIVRFGW